jgi:YggT family protein
MALENLVIKLIDLFKFVMFIWILSSWIPNIQGNPFVQKLDSFFSIFLNPIRKVIPPIGGSIDISPIILFLAIDFLLRPLLLSLVGLLPK